MPDIMIVKKLKDPKDPTQGHKLEPIAGRRTRVKTGELVTFKADPNLLDLHIEFTDRSPFGDGKEVVIYNTTLPVVVAVDTDPKRNVYSYSCTASGETSDDGGEMEVAN